ncbi:MAG: hypothetical protein IJ409_07680 [Lachnospiraceae bacterium]|nr:hypothetical protein [Lachnospiraceae bacterium]
MKLPSIVKRIGEAEGESRVYIEDYVYSYLNELKNRKDVLPLRVALFGHTCSKEQKNLYFIYGAACVVDELAKGRSEEQVRELFFPESELIGYVNVYGERLQPAEKKSGCCIFYDSNEPMQNYLLSCYNREGGEDVSAKEKEALKSVWTVSENKLLFSVGELLKKLLCIFAVLILATAVTTIDEYREMYGFVEAAERAVWVSNIQDERFGDR